jgi:hypothetical protein
MSRSFRYGKEKLSWKKYDELKRHRRRESFNRRSRKLMRKLRAKSIYQ